MSAKENAAVGQLLELLESRYALRVLWALPPGAGPKSLGVLGREPVVRLTATDNDVREVPMLAISLEPKGGVPAGSGPSGPVLFKGALIQTAQ